MIKTIRVYVDTSVYGGVFDDEFKNQSTKFFEQVRKNQFILVTSAVVQTEIREAPKMFKLFSMNYSLLLKLLNPLKKL